MRAVSSPRRTQRLIGLELRGAGRHVLQRRDTDGAGMAQRRARLVHRLLERIGRDRAGDQIHRVVLEDAGRLARRHRRTIVPPSGDRVPGPMPASRMASALASATCPSSR